MLAHLRTLLVVVAVVLCAALGMGLASTLAAAASPAALGAPAQDITTTTIVSFTSNTLVAQTTTTAVQVTEGTQTTISGKKPADQPLFTQSRKIVAIIGALVLVAVCLLLLTIRYWHMTKPTPSPVIEDPSLDVDTLSPYERAVLGARMQAAVDGSGNLADLEGFDGLEAPDKTEPVMAGAPDSSSSTSADHARSDADWLPRGTGEHARIEVPATAKVRPGQPARRKALGLPTEP